MPAVEATTTASLNLDFVSPHDVLLHLATLAMANPEQHNFVSWTSFLGVQLVEHDGPAHSLTAWHPIETAFKQCLRALHDAFGADCAEELRDWTRELNDLLEARREERERQDRADALLQEMLDEKEAEMEQEKEKEKGKGKEKEKEEVLIDY
ncbi:hypothetical protein F5B20DRAFT_548011 [Whalleya microplaca]|nr:hypothetical protein F5B20DRAFT_548011 [Whalleya microplaca]